MILLSYKNHAFSLFSFNLRNDEYARDSYCDIATSANFCKSTVTKFGLEKATVSTDVSNNISAFTYISGKQVIVPYSYQQWLFEIEGRSSNWKSIKTNMFLVYEVRSLSFDNSYTFINICSLLLSASMHMCFES